MNDEIEDYVVKEIDVFISKTLANNIYILQYPVRSNDKSNTETKYLGAKIKPKSKKLEIETELNTVNPNYSRTKGEQFALNVDGKPSLSLLSSKTTNNKEQQRYYKSNVMDKQVLTSSNGTLDQMARLYQLGILKDDKLHLNSIQCILQMKPSFEYFDIYEKKVKEAKDAQHTEMDYSTEEEADNEDKAELVTLKYSSAYASHISNQEPEQNWIPLTYLNKTDENSSYLRNMLYCKSLENILKLDYTQEDFINRLIENNPIVKNA